MKMVGPFHGSATYRTLSVLISVSRGSFFLKKFKNKIRHKKNLPALFFDFDFL